MDSEKPPIIPNGTRVKILGTNFNRCWVVEYRGTLGPNGARVYGVLYRKKPRGYTEVLEEQLEVLPAKTEQESSVG